MSYSTKRFLTALAALSAFVVLAAGCGDDDDDGGGGGNGGDSGGQVAPGNTQETTGEDAPDTRDEAIDKCYEEADKLSGQAKETARASCRAAETGETDELRDEARKQCLDSAKQFPEGDARKQAEDACKQLGGE